MKQPLDPLASLRLQRDAEHLCQLGPRAVAEMLVQLTDRIGGRPALFSVLAEYRRLTPGMVRAAGGDRFPPRPLHVVPQEARR